MRILIVEDDTDTKRFVARGLTELGHHMPAVTAALTVRAGFPVAAYAIRVVLAA